MMNTQDFTTMEQLSMMDSVTNGAVLQYGPLVLVTDNAYREEFTAQIYECVEMCIRDRYMSLTGKMWSGWWHMAGGILIWW